jgi:hypothetical protein
MLNTHNVDVDYVRKRIKRLLRDLNQSHSDEIARELIRIAKTVDEPVLSEMEFLGRASAPKTTEHIALDQLMADVKQEAQRLNALPETRHRLTEIIKETEEKVRLLGASEKITTRETNFGGWYNAHTRDRDEPSPNTFSINDLRAAYTSGVNERQYVPAVAAETVQ